MDARTEKIELDPIIAAKLRERAAAQGITLNELLRPLAEGVNGEITEEEDPRLSAMREAMSDELFLADLAETMEDFKNVDAEFNH
jgi:hypothetical protein